MERSLRSARAVTFVYFVLCGTVMGTWVVHIPAIEQRAGISHATLGSLLLLLGAGAFAGMQAAGRLTDRLGARLVLPAAGVLSSGLLVLPGLARNAWTLAGALVIFGFGKGCLDAGMNAHAVHVEKAYGRPVMSAFHAMFSIGGVVAALAGAGAAGAGMGAAATLAAVAAAGIATALLSARGILPAAPPHPAVSVPDGPGAKRRRAPGRIWVLAVLALMIMLCEGAANDWSALHLKDVLGTSATTAAFGYGTFAATMTIGRLLADRLVARFGPTAILRYGAALGALGITVVALTPWVWAVFAGWALFGLGLSGCVPQLFSAAGHADPAAAGANVSRVAGLGYVGMLAGPAVIGWMTHLTTLNHTFLLLTLLCVIAAASAAVLRTGAGRTREVARSTPRPPVRHN
ncbi:MFS transporter [Streptomyces sp. WAC8370]|uniref:MFS transporter n=1 Tax=Streptomyces sp. WAC8370 TaxID=3351348 RepID=UPI003F7A0411